VPLSRSRYAACQHDSETRAGGPGGVGLCAAWGLAAMARSRAGRGGARGLGPSCGAHATPSASNPRRAARGATGPRQPLCPLRPVKQVSSGRAAGAAAVERRFPPSHKSDRRRVGRSEQPARRRRQRIAASSSVW
jgi:hypothetical protein